MFASPGQTRDHASPQTPSFFSFPWRRGGGTSAAARPLSVLPPMAHPDAEADTHESELIVAVFRTVILMVALLAPRIFGVTSTYNLPEIVLAAFACLYNMLVGLSCLYPHRYGLRRPFVIIVDMLLITLWLRLAQQWELFSLYYIVVIVAAMWYRVFGGIMAAIFCSFFFLFLWSRAAGDPTIEGGIVFPMTHVLNIALLILVGCLVGYIAEAQERERLHRLEGQLLVSNYQREIDLATQLQPLLLASQWMGSQNGEPAHEKPELRSISAAGARTASATVLPDSSLQLGAAMQPARAFGGGDYFDVLPQKGGCTALCIADVSGKSVRAQARLPLLKYSLRALAPLYSDPGELLTRLNETLSPDLHEDLFIGLCYVVLDPQNEQITWCNAGHISPLLIKAAPAVEEGEESAAPEIMSLDASGPALGPFPEIPYSSRTAPWQEGSSLLLYTDGLTDALSYGGSEDGEDQVLHVASAFDGAQWNNPQLIAQRLVDIAVVALDGNTTFAEQLAGVFSPRSRNAQPQRPSDNEDPNNPNPIHRDDITVIAAHFMPHHEAAAHSQQA